MKRYIYINYFLIFLFFSCDFNTYLDKAETGGLSDDEVFGDYVQTERFLANIYSGLLNEWMPISSFTYASASDEAKCPVTYYDGPQVFTRGLLSPSHNPIDNWGALYASIRKANHLIERIDQVPVVNSIQSEGKIRMKGEAYFLRAYFYFELFKRYGRVPIVDRLLQISDDLNLPRNTIDEVVDFIIKDCETAEVLLPKNNSVDNYGRATKGASMMIKAKTYLLAASPLHNPENNKDKWREAAEAAQQIIDLNVYAVDPDYKGLFHKRNASNIIFQSTLNKTDWVREMFIPSRNGKAMLQPTQNIVDAYEMNNGLAIDEAGSGYSTNNPYVNRDPRFYESIIFNGSTWQGETIETFVGGIDGLVSAEGNRTQTGYYLRKLIDENASISPTDRPGDHFWIYMRYEDVLLMYAEAMNEWSDNPDISVYESVNLIRNRVGMPSLPNNLSKDEMRKRIRRERQVELAFEGSRFWDIRRWKIDESTLSEARGMRITKVGSNFTYEPFLVESRIYDRAFDLFPIPQSELNRNLAMSKDQNKGYSN